jgi:hypothetical protein
LRNIARVFFSAVIFCVFDVMRRRHFECAKLRKSPHARNDFMVGIEVPILMRGRSVTLVARRLLLKSGPSPFRLTKRLIERDACSLGDFADEWRLKFFHEPTNSRQRFHQHFADFTAGQGSGREHELSNPRGLHCRPLIDAISNFRVGRQHDPSPFASKAQPFFVGRALVWEVIIVNLNANPLASKSFSYN